MLILYFSHINIFISEKDWPILFYRLFLFKIFSLFKCAPTWSFDFNKGPCFTVFMFTFYCYLNSWVFIHEPDEETCLLFIHLILQLYTEIAGFNKTTCDMSYLALTLTEHLLSLCGKNIGIYIVYRYSA